MMPEVIEMGHYRDNYLLTYYAIDMLEKTITCKTQSLYEHVWEKGTLFHSSKDVCNKAIKTQKIFHTYNECKVIQLHKTCVRLYLTFLLYKPNTYSA